MTNDEGRKPEGAPERSPKAGEGAPSGVDGNGPKRFLTGAGSASRHSIGTGVIGGMLAATFLAILFLPMLFKLVTRERNAGVPAMSPETSRTG